MTRAAAITQLTDAAGALIETDPHEAYLLLRLVERLVQPPRPGECAVGRMDGAADRRIGHRISEVVLVRMYGRDYVKGYGEGWGA